MRDIWLRIGCFLTGHNYSILKNCSEVARKSVKRFTAALVIMCVLWGLIGYSFATRYLHASVDMSLLSSLVFILIIVQVERQIILQTHKNRYLQIFRGVIAVMMAFIGSLIVDQIIFKDDIELKKEQFINNEVEAIYPKRAEIRQKQIDQLKDQLHEKDSLRNKILKDIQEKPMVTIRTMEVTPVEGSVLIIDTGGVSNTKRNYIDKYTTKSSQVPNPNTALLAPLDSQINSIQRMILSQGDSLANLRSSTERMLKEKTGFLNELNIMSNLLSTSIPALVVYVVWFILLLGLELFILMNKRHDQTTDYDALISHQMAMHIKRLDLLANKTSNSK